MPKGFESKPTAQPQPPPADQPIQLEATQRNSSPTPVARMPVAAGSKEYNMNHKRRGVAVIFNHVIFDDEEAPERKGSCVDAMDLLNTFTLLGFETTVHHDLTRSEITEELKTLSKKDYGDCDCFCLVALTHGETHDLLYARDALYLQSELWDPFIPRRCLSLAGKPKLFFIQACRGKQFEKNTLLVRGGAPSGTRIDGLQNNWSYVKYGRLNWSYVIPSKVDFLISHSTCAGFCSHRDPNHGSWYIQSLCRTLTAEHATTDLLTMLTNVHRRVVIEFESFVQRRPDLTGLKETPSFTSTLMRAVYFRPKPKLDDNSGPQGEQADGGASLSV